MKVNWRVELPQLALIAVMFVLAALIWPSAPDRIPIHWNAAGEVDGYGGKAEGLLLLPATALGLYLLLLFLPRADPGRANYLQFAGVYALIRIAVLVLLAAIYGFVLLWIRGVEVDMARLPFILIGGLFLVLGNAMGKIRPNWFVGVRTPWTLSSKRSWVKTHRLAGWLFVLVGLIFLGAAVVGDGSLMLWLILGSLGVMTLALVVYSYLVWRDDPEKTPPSSTLPE